MVMRTDLIPWCDFLENQTEDLTSEKLTFLGETRNDGWRCEGACVNTDGITMKVPPPNRRYEFRYAKCARQTFMDGGAICPPGAWRFTVKVF